MYSRLCMCDVCTEGRLSKGGKKQRKRKTKNEKKERKTFQGARVRSSMSLGDRLVPQGSVPPWTWPKNDRRAVQVLLRPEKKGGWRWSPEGERIDARSQKREQKILDHIGSLKASELVAPMLEQKNLDHILFLKANELMLARKNANRKIWITLVSWRRAN